MKILTLLFVLLSASVNSQELNQNTIIPYLDNLIKSEDNIYQEQMKRGRFKLFPLYSKDFENQPKFDPGADFLINNFDLVMKNKKISNKYRQSFEMPNFHFNHYVFSKAVDSKKVDIKKLYNQLYYVSNRRLKNHFLEKANFYFSNPHNKGSKLSFRDYFLIFNYTMAPRSHYIKEFRKSRFLRGQHISYVDLNRTKMRKGSLSWQVKADTINALKKIKPFKGDVYSGLKTNPNLDKKIMKNDILCFGGFLSTSVDKKVAQDYRVRVKSNFLYKIKSKTGKYIDRFSKFGGEAEVLFYPYKKFKLIKIFEENYEPDRGDFGDFGGFGDFEDESSVDAEKIKVILLEEIKDYKGPCKSLTRGKKIRPREYWGN